MKRGVTPILATIILLMMAVAASATTYYWLTRIQGQMQGDTERYEISKFEKLASEVDWLNALYSSSGEWLAIYIKNTGPTEILISNTTEDPTTSWIVTTGGDVVICSTKWDGLNNNPGCISGCGGRINPSQLRTVNLSLSNTLCDLSAYSSSRLGVDIYFGAKTSTSGSFET